MEKHVNLSETPETKGFSELYGTYFQVQDGAPQSVDAAAAMPFKIFSLTNYSVSLQFASGADR